MLVAYQFYLSLQIMKFKKALACVAVPSDFLALSVALVVSAALMLSIVTPVDHSASLPEQPALTESQPEFTTNRLDIEHSPVTL
jgi:flagellar basal body-associated protein FliL